MLTPQEQEVKEKDASLVNQQNSQEEKPKSISHFARIHKNLIRILGLITAIVASVTAGITIFDHFRSHPANVLIENIIPFQIPMEGAFTESPSQVSWEVVFSIANLEKDTIAIRKFSPQFPHTEFDGHTWQLKDDRLFLVGQVFDSEEELRSYYLTEKSVRKQRAEQHIGMGPFLLKPGEKKFYIFNLKLTVYRDDVECSHCISSNDEDFIAILIQNGFDDKDRPRCGSRELPVVLGLDNNRELTTSAFTWMSIPGCVLTLPPGMKLESHQDKQPAKNKKQPSQRQSK